MYPGTSHRALKLYFKRIFLRVILWQETLYRVVMVVPKFSTVISSVVVPDPNDVGPLGSWSRSFHHQAKIVSTVLWLLYDFLSLKNDVNVSLKSNKQKNFQNNYFLMAFMVTDEKSRIRIRIRSADLDPYNNVTDPQQWLFFSLKLWHCVHFVRSDSRTYTYIYIYSAHT
jgi:hypothetical protein